MKFEILVQSNPIAQPRQRHRIAGKGKKQFVQSYVEAKHPVHQFKADCQRAAKQVFDGELLQGPLSVSVLFVFPRPSNRIWKTKPMPRELHTKKPDADNCVKAVWDALTKVIWKDDAQICDSKQSKRVAAGDEQPHVLVTVEEVNGLDQT